MEKWRILAIMICNCCKTEIKKLDNAKNYKINLISMLINTCVDRLKTGKCEANLCKDRFICKFKQRYFQKNLGTDEKNILGKELKDFFEKTVNVKSSEPYCSKGNKIYCPDCGPHIVTDLENNKTVCVDLRSDKGKEYLEKMGKIWGQKTSQTVIKEKSKKLNYKIKKARTREDIKREIEKLERQILNETM